LVIGKVRVSSIGCHDFFGLGQSKYSESACPGTRGEPDP
jgi:hypothetical protein